MNRNQQGQEKKAAELELLLNVPLANALGGPNPTLNTQALATRTAEKIFHLYFGGDLWVGREASFINRSGSHKQYCIAVCSSL